MKRVEEQAVPPLAPWLSEAVAATRPVRTRRPWRSLAAVSALGLAGMGALLALWVGVRPDLPSLPRAPFLIYLGLCVVAFVAQLWAALVPPTGAVLPSGRRAAWLALLFTAAAAPLGLAVGLRWPGLGPAAAHGPFWAPAAGCLTLGAFFALTPLLLGLGVLARLTPRGPWGAAVAVSGASGVLAGLGLTLHCPRADVLHVVVAHGLPMVLPMALVAALGALLSRRRSDAGDEAP